MGAVNDLGNAIVVGRNLGHGKEESDINDYDTGNKLANFVI